MFENICSLPLPNDLFAQALSPRDPLLAVGLSSGHVHCYQLPPVESSDDEEDLTKLNGASNGRRSSLASESGCDTVDLAWKTRRHKGSCRCLDFSLDGEKLYSAGTDGIVKVARSETGVVEWKLAVPLSAKSAEVDSPSLLHNLSPQTLLLATDSSALHLFDIRSQSQKPQITFHPHDDYISSLTALPASDASTSGFSKQWVTTGGTTLAVTDLRRGVLVKSEDQDEELLSSCFIGGLSSKGTSVGEKIVVGGASGVLTLWERGVWDDQDERIIVDKGPAGGESIDCLVSVPDSVGGLSKAVVAGVGNGLLALVKIGPNKIVDVLKHDEVEGVVSIGFDVGGRMITGGGPIIKVWYESKHGQNGDQESDDGVEKNGKRDDSSEDDVSSEEDSDVDAGKPPRKKRRKTKGKRGITNINGAGSTKPSFNGLD